MTQRGKGTIRAVSAQGLTDMIATIRACDRHSEVAFKDLIMVAIKLMSITTATELGGRLAYKASISKWVNEPTAIPARAVREVVIGWIEEQAVKKLTALQQGTAVCV